MENYSYIASKALDIANDLQRLDSQMNDMYKINLYLLRKYKDDLIKEFNIKRPEHLPQEFYIFNSLFPDATLDEQTILDEYEVLAVMNKIRDIMNKEMPEPWYFYSTALSMINNGDS